jgi:hypothetical protein
VALPEPAVKSRVFISYSRKDLEFAGRLAAALRDHGFQAHLDQSEMAPGEPWMDRLGKLIEASDALLFLLSPDSMNSKVCAWEVDKAERLGKRVLPALCRPAPATHVPGRLSRLSWIDFTEAQNFGAALANLERTLLADAAWGGELTRLLGLAKHWEQGGRQSTQLMSETNIKATEKLLAARPQHASAPPQLLGDFLDASHARIGEGMLKLRRIAGRAFVAPALQALHEGRTDSALRLVAAGALLADDLRLELAAELRSPLIRAALHLLNGHGKPQSGETFAPDDPHPVSAAAPVLDAARSAPVAQGPEFLLTAALARGIGWRTEDEATGLLMQDAPENLYAKARAQLLDPAKYAADEIARRERALEETITALHAPSHSGCYLSPMQFAEKFGLGAEALQAQVESQPELAEISVDAPEAPADGDIPIEIPLELSGHEAEPLEPAVQPTPMEADKAPRAANAKPGDEYLLAMMSELNNAGRHKH